MKNKFLAILGGVCVAATMCGFAACGETAEVKTGEYKYENPWAAGSYYGVKVEVEATSTEIKSVKIVESDYVQVSESWTEKALWIDAEADYLKKFEGVKIDALKDVEVVVAATGVPNAIEGFDIVTGATQSCGRVVLAVQNALGIENKAVVYSGEYKYENAWVAGAYYGVKVNVEMKNDKVTEVSIVASDYTQVTSSWADKALWEDGEADYLAKFVGKTAAEIGAIEVVTAKNGQPNAVNGFDIITGATQSCGRLVLAIQNALGVTNQTVVASGEYKYENPWVADAYYGVKVNVTLDGDKIVKVEIVASDYTQVTSSWADKALWENGEADYLAKFAGKTVAEIGAVVVNCKASGEPSSVEGFDIIIGATQSCGRLILAIQNAIA